MILRASVMSGPFTSAFWADELTVTVPGAVCRPRDVLSAECCDFRDERVLCEPYAEAARHDPIALILLHKQSGARGTTFF